MKHVNIVCFLGVCCIVTPCFAEQTSQTASFDDNQRPARWVVNTGHWEAENGVLVCRELAADKHAAAARWQIPLSDGIVRCKLKFAGATAFHIGFDPAPGTLEKKGHLYSLVLTPTSAAIRKHKDKADPKSKDELLATLELPATTEWMNIELNTTGDKVMVQLQTGDSRGELTVSDPTFHVAKPTVVFRTVGGDALLDDVSLEVLKPGLLAQPAKKAK